MDKQYTLEDLIHIIKTLRGPNGCPWDKEQTHASLKNSLLEESYEVIEAINREDLSNMKEELGDVLLQVIMHAEIASENNAFTLEDVIQGISEKLVYRHPHVFGDEADIRNSEDVNQKWEELKKKEKHYKSTTEAIEAIPKALPALIRAQKTIKKAAEVGFIWDDIEPIYDKILEEIEEVKKATQSLENSDIEMEIGDLLLSIANLGYFLQINTEFALTKAVEKFINRFRYIENSAFAVGKTLSDMTLKEMDTIWEECKKQESNV